MEICDPICWLTFVTRPRVAANLGSSEKTAVCATTPRPPGVVARATLLLNVASIKSRRLDVCAYAFIGTVTTQAQIIAVRHRTPGIVNSFTRLGCSIMWERWVLGKPLFGKDRREDRFLYRRPTMIQVPLRFSRLKSADCERRCGAPACP